jgi:O-antigen ligase
MKAQSATPMRGGDPAKLRARPFSWEALFGVVIGLLLAASLVVQTLDMSEALSGAIWRIAVVMVIVVCIGYWPRGRDVGRFMLIFTPWLAMVALGTAVHGDLESVADLIKQAFIITFGALIYANSNQPNIRRMAFWALITCGTLALAFSLAQVLPVLSHGWSYTAARELKTQSYNKGFGSNTICFGGLVAVLACFRDELLPRQLLIASAVLLTLCSALLTARAPVGALLLGAMAAAALAWWQPREVFGRSVGHAWLWVAALWGGVIGLFFSLVQTIAHSQIAVALAGRAALWQIGLVNFWENPVFGSGAHTYTQVIRANLGHAHMTVYWQRTALYSLQGGGVHNQWLNVLTERGAVGFAGLFVSYTALFAFALFETGQVSFRRRLTLLIILFFMLLRGMFEISGLFSYGDGAIDAVAMMAVALNLPHAPGPLRIWTSPARAQVRKPGQRRVEAS